MSKISVYDFMTKNRVLLSIIGQNDINSKLLQPIVASICKVMTVEKPCVNSKLDVIDDALIVFIVQVKNEVQYNLLSLFA